MGYGLVDSLFYASENLHKSTILRAILAFWRSPSRESRKKSAEKKFMLAHRTELLE